MTLARHWRITASISRRSLCGECVAMMMCCDVCRLHNINRIWSGIHFQYTSIATQHKQQHFPRNRARCISYRWGWERGGRRIKLIVIVCCLRCVRFDALRHSLERVLLCWWLMDSLCESQIYILWCWCFRFHFLDCICFYSDVKPETIYCYTNAINIALCGKTNKLWNKNTILFRLNVWHSIYVLYSIKYLLHTFDACVYAFDGIN